MRIFLSWSGSRSRLLASALKDWIPDVLYDVECWMSAHDIQAGERWSDELDSVLSQCRLGVVSITRENQHSPWLLFEAGAMSKRVADGRVIPLLFDLPPTELALPLSQFQMLECDRSGIQRLLETINSARDSSLAQDRLTKQFDRWWPDLETAISEARDASELPTAERSEKEMLHEILSVVRSLVHPAPIADTPLLRLSLDTTHIFETGKFTELYIPSTTSIARFLDVVWSMLDKQGDIEPWTYGTRWLLYNTRTHDTYRNIDSRRFADPAIKERSVKPVTTLGISDGDLLEVRPP